MTTNNNSLEITASDINTHVSGSTGVINTGTANASFLRFQRSRIRAGLGERQRGLSPSLIRNWIASQQNTIIIGDSSAGAIPMDDLTLGAQNLTLTSGSSINDTDDTGDAIVTTGTLTLSAGTHIGNLTSEGFSFRFRILGFGPGTTSEVYAWRTAIQLRPGHSDSPACMKAT